MIIAAEYPFNDGLKHIKSKYPHLLGEIYEVIAATDASGHQTKESKEKNRSGAMLFSPTTLNSEIKKRLEDKSWCSQKRIPGAYLTEFYTKEFQKSSNGKRFGKPYREMDFVKKRLGLEVQFGTYSFMVYDVCAKMIIFKKKGIIDMGVEIVPIKQFADEMPTSVSSFEKIIWDLKTRGSSNIDIPVLILGIDRTRDLSE